MPTPAQPPNYRTGKICYLEIPARDIAESARFYQRVFGWHIRQRGDGAVAFDDTVGGEIVQAFDDGEVYAYFRDPAGNLLGVYQQPGLAESERPE
jgi:predicted enzyme related to lactoylglutathione lyase